MARLFIMLLTVTSLAACSSGVSNKGAGGAGTNCDIIDLICTALLSPASFSSDAFATDTDGDPDTTDDIEFVEADFATVTINMRDPLGRFSRVFQGATFNVFRITFLRQKGGAPNLGPRDVAETINIELSGNTGTGSVTIPIVDNVTKREFRQQSGGSGTVHVYTVRVQAIGRDFATNTQITVEARATVEIGEFISTGGGSST